MSELTRFKIKKNFFLTMGWSFYILSLIFITYKFFEINSLSIGSCLGLFFIFFIYFIICIIIEGNIGDKNFSFLNIFFIKKLKIIYHIDLGYFLVYLSNSEKYGKVTFRLHCYQQKVFYMKEIFDRDLGEESDISSERISSIIKKELDQIYENKIKLVEELKLNKIYIDSNKEIVKNVESKLNQWDGCLDKQSRRDHKINQIIK